MASRFVVGLDLGTTNTAIAFVDTKDWDPEDSEARAPIQTFPIPQLIKSGEVGEEPLLPTFLYLPLAGEISTEALQLPWNKQAAWATGRFAREHGGLVPTRLVSSAKSWLCHPGVDRRGKILPWAAEPDFPKISPLDACVRYLEHCRDSWNHRIAGKDRASRFEQQEIVLTVPASFEAVARELTIEAAHLAGFETVTLLEEPQAAFYAWLHQAGRNWRQAVAVGDCVLILDVGGGTTDLTLIGVTEEEGELRLDRLAVGDHLLLGGDNMDLTLAHALAASIREKIPKLDANQLLGLWHACRPAKEKLLSDPKAKPQALTILGRGSKVVGGAIKAELTRELVESVIVEGFLPKVDRDAIPETAPAIGLQEIGLSYENDPAITRHLAGFLTRHGSAIQGYRSQGGAAGSLPSAVLFNGGVFQATPLRSRILDLLQGWNQGEQGDTVRELASGGLDRAVAEGAAYYGLARRGRGVRIRGGIPRSYYIGIESAVPAVPGLPRPIKALCIVPQGLEEGTEAELPGREFSLRVGQPVAFRFLSSTSRREDGLGTTVEDWEGTIDELAPMEATLKANDSAATVPVRLHVRATEVGTLELWFESRAGEKWKLEFNVREAEA